jgi:phosphoserine phosphatase
MGGSVLFQDALTQRLNIIQPSQKDIQAHGQNHPFQFTPGVEKLIELLHAKGKVVYLVSGGFRQVIF